MPVKKIPERTCVGCREVHPKKELIRVVKYNDEISLDFTGKKPGRGAYICRNEECFEKLKKNKGLNRALEANIPEEIYDTLKQELIKNRE